MGFVTGLSQGWSEMSVYSYFCKHCHITECARVGIAFYFAVNLVLALL